MARHDAMKRGLHVRLDLDARLARPAAAALLVLCAPVLLAAGTDSLTVSATFPPPTAVFTSGVVTTGSAPNPGNTSLVNATYLNRYGGDTLLAPKPPATGPSANHVVIGKVSGSFPTPYAKVEIAGALRAQKPSWNPIPTSGGGLELYYDGSYGHIEPCGRSGGSCTPEYLEINGAGTGSTVQIGGNGANGTNVGIAGAPVSGYALTVNEQSYQTAGGANWATSDARLKDIEGRYSAGLKEILNLHPVRFNFKKGNPLRIRSDGEHVGLVAQEVREALPEAVKLESNKFLSVNIDPVVLAMLNAIQEQQTEIEELRRQLSSRQGK